MRPDAALDPALHPVSRLAGFSKRLNDDEMIWAGRLCGRFDPPRFERTLRAFDEPIFIAWAEDDPSVERKVSEALIACANDPEVHRFADGGQPWLDGRLVSVSA